MRRSKSSKPGLLPWLSARGDGKEKRFIQIGNTLLLSKEFSALGTGAQHLYFCMAMESGGKRRFVFPQSAAKKYGITPSSLRRHVKELEEAGFLSVTSLQNLRQPNEYEFSLRWKEPPRTAPASWLYIVDAAQNETRPLP